ncbi:MAG: tetratricopeptide repeat protein [Myxococcales bacterium]|nr:tetratricopeptide repeat protein [Myxococcales bacterium]
MATAAIVDALEALLRAGKLDAALRDVSTLLEKNPRDADGLVFRGRLLAAQGEVDAGLAALEEALRADGGHRSARTFKAALLLEKGDDAGARRLLEAVLKEAPKDAAANFQLCRCVARAGRFDEADRLISRAVEADPNNALYLFAKARVMADLGRPDDSIEWLGKTVKANPRLVEAWLVLANLQGRGGRHAAAAKNLESALQHNPGHPGLRDALVNASLAAGDLPEAIATAESLAAEVPSADVLTNLAACYLAAQRFSDAEGALRRAIATDEKNARALHLLGTLLESAGALDEALALFERAIAAEPGFWKPYNDLGLIHLERRKEPAAALPLLEKAVALSGEQAPEAIFNLALAHARLGHSGEAKKLCAKVQGHPAAAGALKKQARELAQAAGG